MISLVFFGRQEETSSVTNRQHPILLPPFFPPTLMIWSRSYLFAWGIRNTCDSISQSRYKIWHVLFFFLSQSQSAVSLESWTPYLSYSQSCCISVLKKHSLKRQCMVWQKLSNRDFGEAYRHLDSGTLSRSSVK